MRAGNKATNVNALCSKFPSVTDFSFVSSDFGIPFATNVGALAVTRCESAARYICALATLLMNMCAVRFFLMCSYLSSYTVSGS